MGLQEDRRFLPAMTAALVIIYLMLIKLLYRWGGGVGGGVWRGPVGWGTGGAEGGARGARLHARCPIRAPLLNILAAPTHPFQG
jgi:hypothetical protein